MNINNPFKKIPNDANLIQIFKRLGNLDNAKISPGHPDSKATQFVIDCYERSKFLPPIFIWRFLNEDKERDDFIFAAIRNFNWGDEWYIEHKRNKWGLYPRRVRLVEKELRGIEGNEDFSITTPSLEWLRKNDPEFGLRANEKFLEFTKYIRNLAEEFLEKRDATLS